MFQDRCAWLGQDVDVTSAEPAVLRDDATLWARVTTFGTSTLRYTKCRVSRFGSLRLPRPAFDCLGKVDISQLSGLTSLVDLHSVEIIPHLTDPLLRGADSVSSGADLASSGAEPVSSQNPSSPYSSLCSLTTFHSLSRYEGYWSDDASSDVESEVSEDTFRPTTTQRRLLSITFPHLSGLELVKYPAQSIARFCPSAGSFPSLLELNFDRGEEGYSELCLAPLTALTHLRVDKVEFLDVRKITLPHSLVSLELSAFYSLPELYVLNEQGDMSVVTHQMGLKAARLEEKGKGVTSVVMQQMGLKAARLEEKGKAHLHTLLMGLPALETLTMNWDLDTSRLRMPSLRVHVSGAAGGAGGKLPCSELCDTSASTSASALFVPPPLRQPLFLLSL
eukprot:gene3867-13930_t